MAAVAFQSDGAAGRELERGFQDFAVARAMGDAVGHGDDKLVPIQRAEVRELQVRAGDEVVAGLELRASHVHTAVGIGRGAELEFEDKVLRELAGRPQLLDPAAAGRGGGDDASGLGEPTTIGATRETVVAGRFGHDRPQRGGKVGGLHANRGGDFFLGRGPRAPAGEVVAVKKTDKARLGREGVGRAFAQAERGEERTQGGGKLGVAGGVGVEEIGELGERRVVLGVGEEFPRVEDGDLRLVDGGFEDKLVDAADEKGRTLFGGRAGHHGADDHGQGGIVIVERGENETEITGDGPGGGVFLQVVGADEQNDGGGMQGEDVFLKADEHPACGVPADPAVGDLELGERRGERGAPTLGDRIAEEDDGFLIALHLTGPRGTAFGPEFLKPRIAADRAGAG